MTALREGGAKVASGGKNGETFKRISQSGMLVDQILWPLTGTMGTHVQYQPIGALLAETVFAAHAAAVKPMGFALFVKPVKVGMSKHVRVRARFDRWTASGTITVLDERITLTVLERILSCAGALCGVCDWRPSSPRSPGPFGKFTAAVETVG
jgi:hypothetical protein